MLGLAKLKNTFITLSSLVLLQSCAIQGSNGVEFIDRDFFPGNEQVKLPDVCSKQKNSQYLHCDFDGLEKACDRIYSLPNLSTIMDEKTTLLACDSTITSNKKTKASVIYSRGWGWDNQSHYYGNYLLVKNNSASLIYSKEQLEKTFQPISSSQEAVVFLSLTGTSTTLKKDSILTLKNGRFYTARQNIKNPHIKKITEGYRIVTYKGYNKDCTDKITKIISFIKPNGHTDQTQEVIWQHRNPPACIG